MIGNDLQNIEAIHHFASKSNGWILTDGTSSLAKKIGLATRQYQNIPQNKAKVIALVNSKENSPSSMIPKFNGKWMEIIQNSDFTVNNDFCNE